MTAGFVVGLIVFYYLTAYDPEKDPFGREIGQFTVDSTVPFKPNPVDMFLCKSTRRLWRKLGAKQLDDHHQSRRDDSYVKV